MTYDDWKLDSNDDIETEFECPECGNPVSKEGEYCSNVCFEAGQL